MQKYRIRLKKLTGAHTFRKIREWLKLGTKSLKMLASLKFGPPRKRRLPLNIPALPLVTNDQSLIDEKGVSDTLANDV